MLHSPETLEAPSLYVSLDYCRRPEKGTVDLFGPFTYTEARAFIVSAIAGDLVFPTFTMNRPIPQGTAVHGAMIIDTEVSDNDGIIEKWTARFTNGSPCKALEPHRAGEA